MTIQGLTLAHTRNTYMEPFEVPSGGDWALHRGGCIFVDNAEEIRIAYNIFVNNGNNGVFFANHVVNSEIAYNEFALGSDSGILFLGSTQLMNGVAETHPHDNLIEHNLFRELGLYNKQSSPFMQSKTAVALVFLSHAAHALDQQHLLQRPARRHQHQRRLRRREPHRALAHVQHRARDR